MQESYPLYGNEIDTKKSAFDEVPDGNEMSTNL